MWFGTPDGLCRYDGSELRTFKYHPKNSNDTVNNFVRGKILEDKNGNIWYSNEIAIYKWDRLKEQIVKTYEFTNVLNNGDYHAMTLDSTGALWLFNIFKGIFEYDIYSGVLKQYPFPQKTDAANILSSYNTTDNAGNIWLRVISKNEPYVIFNKTSHHYTSQFQKDPPHAVFFKNKKQIDAYDDRLVYNDLTNNTSYTAEKIIDGKKISFHSFDGVKDNYGRLWMTARGNGLFYYDEKKNLFHGYHHDNSKIKSLPFDLTTCLYIDRSDNLWIGIDGGEPVGLKYSSFT